MASNNFQKALPLVLKHEGGFVNHPKDPGGATNKGITIGTYRQYVKRNGTAQDLRNITDEQVATVYRKHYWDKVKADDLPSGVDYAVFDFAVNSGPARAARYLQRVLGVTQDGQIGPQTIAAASAVPSAQLINALCDARMSFLKGLNTWPTFGRGWTSRVTDVRKHALAMAGGADVTQLQRDLVALGYNLKVDGIQGPETTRMIRQFQVDNALQADGIAGPMTLDAIKRQLAFKTSPTQPAPRSLWDIIKGWFK